LQLKQRKAGRGDFSESKSLAGDVLGLVKDDTFVFNLEPLHGVLLGDPVLDPNTGLAPPTTANSITRSFQHNIEVHTINTSRRVIPRKGGNTDVQQAMMK